MKKKRKLDLQPGKVEGEKKKILVGNTFTSYKGAHRGKEEEKGQQNHMLPSNKDQTFQNHVNN